MKMLSLLSIILIFICTFSLKANENIDKIYQVSSKELKNVPREYYSFLEGVDYNLTYEDLAKADWSSKMQTPQSFYDGYWIRIKILNNTKQEKLGLHHNWNFEKKLIYKNNQLLREFPFVDSEDRPYMYRTDERIWYDYKIQMPVGEVTEIFSYFRSQPLDRLNSRPGSIDRILIGTWEEIEFREMIRVSQYLIIVPVLFCFSLYFLCFFFVSKESSYLWIAIILAAVMYQFVAFSLSSIFGIRFNYMYGPLGFSLISYVLIQFYRNILQLNRNFSKVDNIYIWLGRIYIFLALMYLFDSFSYPNGEIYKDLVNYPYPKLGVGTIPVRLSLIPIGMINISAVIISYLLWRKGDNVSKYLLLSFIIPVVVVAVYLGVSVSSLFEEDYKLRYLLRTSLVFITIFVPVLLGMALAQKLNDMKQNAIDLLEEKVLSRTKALTEANQLITKSVDSASMIQNAILPKFDHQEHGFEELKYLWMPRDVVGGDFYWVGKKGDWTCLVVADCTGHGIPGAFMTLISTTLLNRVKEIVDLSHPDLILDSLDFLLEETLKFNENTGTEFGLDGGVCCFSQKQNLLRFAGAKMNLYYKSANEIFELKGNKKSLGYVTKPHPQSFDVHDVSLSSSPTFYLFSDGLTDQVGGPKKIMYGKKRIIRKISEISDLDLTIQNISQDFERYQGENRRRDDISLFGFRVSNQVKTV